MSTNRWRNQYEDGEPYTPPHGIYVEHMNTLAKRGSAPDAERFINPKGRGHGNAQRTMKRYREQRVTQAEIDAAATEVRLSFDDLYRATLREIRRENRKTSA